MARDSLDLQHLETLLAVLSTGSFREAGSVLGYAQPTVSQHIRKLETAVRTRLIERGASGCVPTPEGAILARYAERVVRITRRARQALLGQHLAVGASSNIGIYLLQPALHDFATRAEGVPVDLTIGTNPDIIARLEDEEIDLALVEWWDDRPGFAAVAWRREPLVVIVPPDHPWARRRHVEMPLLRELTLLGGEPGTGTGRILREATRESGMALGPARALGSTEAVKRAVQAGNGISIVLAGTVEQEVKAGLLVALPIAGAALQKTFYAVFRKALPTTAPAHALLDLLAAEAAKIAPA